MPQNQLVDQTFPAGTANPWDQIPTPNNMPQQSQVQTALSGMMGQPGPQWANWPGFGGQQAPSLRGTPEYVPIAAHGSAPQTATPVQTPQALNPQYPGTSGNFTGQQPVPPPSTQPDMNSVMNNLVSGAAQNLGGAQAQPQIHPAIQQFQGMLQGLQNNPQMLQSLFGSMPGGLQGFMSMLQPLLGAMPQAQGQGGVIKEGSAKIGPGTGGGGNLSKGALAMLKSLKGGQNTATTGQNLVQMR